jgi:SAM-dependent methyltransferase
MDRLSGFQMVLHGILPALLPPETLIRLTRTHYEKSYRNITAELRSETFKWDLEGWEEQVVARHMTTIGTVLVLGAGFGREAIALAERGYQVVGLDNNRDGLIVAARQAAAQGLQAPFVQGDFLALPILPFRLEYLLLSGVMYSSIPGRQRRQTWVRSLRSSLKQGGKTMLNFLAVREPETNTFRVIRTWTSRLLRLPGSNRDYQTGDYCSQGHFMHLFTDEQEIRSELTEAGATILELNWREGFAVIA